MNKHQGIMVAVRKCSVSTAMPLILGPKNIPKYNEDTHMPRVKVNHGVEFFFKYSNLPYINMEPVVFT